MTREERLELLKQIEKDIYVCSLESTFIDDVKSCAIRSAIEELEQEPCEDCISRQAVCDMIEKAQIITDGEFCGYCIEDIDINTLPSVTPQPKTGHWVRVDKNKLRCSKCEVIHLIAQYPNGKIDWCPNCGAKMVESQGRSDKEWDLVS